MLEALDSLLSELLLGLLDSDDGELTDDSDDAELSLDVLLSDKLLSDDSDDSLL